jgi:hypothetical protein
MSHELHPLALEFVNTQRIFKEIAPGSHKDKQKPIEFVLLNLSTKSFGYIDVMQDYITLMKQDLDSLRRFNNLVNNICHLARRYMETDGKNEWKFQKEQVLMCLNCDIEWVPIQINDSVMIQNGDNLFQNPICYTIGDSHQHIRPFLKKLLKKIHDTVNMHDYHDVLLAICRHLNEQVVPILQVLTDLKQKQGGNDFIQHLDLIALIEKLKQIKELEQQIEIADQTQAENRKQRESLMRTSTFNVNSIMPQVKSLVADKQFAQAEAAGNASQSVIGDRIFSAKGGRRTRHKHSGHKKRSAHKKRSGKRSGKSVHKSRRR